MGPNPTIFLLDDAETIPASRLEDAEQSLTKLDHDRLRHMASARRKRQFLCGRLLLQQGLLEKTGKSLKITTAENGAPVCSDPQLHCSLSHSGNSIAACIAMGERVGIDIELKRQRNFHAIAEQYFHPSETALLQTIPAQKACDWFYGAWTCKEAVAKLTGAGLTTTLTLREREARQKYHLLQFDCEKYTLSVAFEQFPVVQNNGLVYSLVCANSGELIWIRNQDFCRLFQAKHTAEMCPLR